MPDIRLSGRAAFDDAVRRGDAGPLLWCYRYSGRIGYLMAAFKGLRRVGVRLSQTEKDYFRVQWQRGGSPRVGKPRRSLLRTYYILSGFAFLRQYGLKFEDDKARRLRPHEVFKIIADERGVPVSNVIKLWKAEQQRLRRQARWLLHSLPKPPPQSIGGMLQAIANK